MSKDGEPMSIGTRGVDVILVFGMVVAVVLLFGITVRLWVPAKPRAVKLEEFKYQSWTNGNEAHVYLTNLNADAVRGCFKGIVTARKGGAKAETAVVCSGEVAPYSSVDLRAPYEVHAIEELCSSEVGEGLYRRKELDWDRCTFTVTDYP